MNHKDDRSRFGLLVLLLVATLALSGLSNGAGVRLGIAGLNLAVITVGFVGTRAKTRLWKLAGLLIAGIVGTVLVASYGFADLGVALGATLQVIILGTLAVAVLARLLEHPSVTNQTMLGAVASYLLLGQVFAWAYMALPGYFDETVLAPAQQGEVPIYYSYVVLTTLGFGDIHPVGALAQRITVLEALLGQLYLAILLSRLASLYSRDQLHFARPDDPTDESTT
ncbi:MAG: two pore domain potassium channel family protein [Actinomycetia bacterium]|nr:two pore domain potassium channel family protein [Actinomycetes bacterium]